MTAEDFHATSKPRPGILQALERDVKRDFAGTEAPVLLCFTSDPYQPGQADHDTTREAIGILRDHDIPVHILTKGGMRAARDFPLLKRPDCAFGTTLCWTDDADRKHWEAGAALVLDRITAIKLAHELGIRTWVSVEPIIVPEQAIALIGELSQWVDEWRVGKLNYHPLAREIDWATWTPRIMAALQQSGRDYLVKASLQPFVGGVA
jgi:DNA repair photolyase